VRGFVYEFIKMFTPDITDFDLRNFLKK